MANQYSSNFRVMAVDRMDSGDTPLTLSRELGVSYDTLLRWRRDAYAASSAIEQPALPESPPADYSMFVWLHSYLPTDGRWTRQWRDRYVALYVALIDFLIEVVPPEHGGGGG